MEGVRYEGDFINGVKEGKGVMTLNGNEKYDGDFKNDAYNG